MSAPADTALHEEALPFGLIRYVELVFWALTVLFLTLLYCQVMFGPIGSRPAPNLAYLLMVAVMGGTAFLMRNFQMLRVRITGIGIQLSFGMFRRRIAWDDIAGCDLDRATWLRYGGWGIRIGRVNGVWRWVYNTIGPERVVVSLKRGRFREVAFSTSQPGRVMALIDELTRVTGAA